MKTRFGTDLLEFSQTHQNRRINIPVIGSIPAGIPEERSQEREDCVMVDWEQVGFPKPSARVFALRVTGDSMNGAGIISGDFAIIEHGKEARPGSIVAAFIDGRSTLKRFFVRGGKPFLKAENPKYRDLVPCEELMIQGVLVGVYRRTE